MISQPCDNNSSMKEDVLDEATKEDEPEEPSTEEAGEEADMIQIKDDLEVADEGNEKLDCEDNLGLDDKIALHDTCHTDEIGFYVDPFIFASIVVEDKDILIAFGAISPSTSSGSKRRSSSTS